MSISLDDAMKRRQTKSEGKKKQNLEELAEMLVSEESIEKKLQKLEKIVRRSKCMKGIEEWSNYFAAVRQLSDWYCSLGREEGKLLNTLDIIYEKVQQGKSYAEIAAVFGKDTLELTAEIRQSIVKVDDEVLRLFTKEYNNVKQDDVREDLLLWVDTLYEGLESGKSYAKTAALVGENIIGFFKKIRDLYISICTATLHMFSDEWEFICDRRGEGKIMNLATVAYKKIQEGKSDVEIAADLEESVESIAKIRRAIKEYEQKYDRGEFNAELVWECHEDHVTEPLVWAL